MPPWISCLDVESDRARVSYIWRLRATRPKWTPPLILVLPVTTSRTPFFVSIGVRPPAHQGQSRAVDIACVEAREIGSLVIFIDEIAIHFHLFTRNKSSQDEIESVFQHIPKTRPQSTTKRPPLGPTGAENLMSGDDGGIVGRSCSQVVHLFLYLLVTRTAPVGIQQMVCALPVTPQDKVD